MASLNVWDSADSRLGTQASVDQLVAGWDDWSLLYSSHLSGRVVKAYSHGEGRWRRTGVHAGALQTLSHMEDYYKVTWYSSQMQGRVRMRLFFTVYTSYPLTQLFSFLLLINSPIPRPLKLLSHHDIRLEI